MLRSKTLRNIARSCITLCYLVASSAAVRSMHFVKCNCFIPAALALAGFLVGVRTARLFPPVKTTAPPPVVWNATTSSNVTPTNWANLRRSLLNDTPALPEQEYKAPSGWVEYKQPDWHIILVWMRDQEKAETRLYALQKDKDLWRPIKHEVFPDSKDRFGYPLVDYADKSVMFIDDKGLLIHSLPLGDQ
jgi:hypothetical protein